MMRIYLGVHNTGKTEAALREATGTVVGIGPKLKDKESATWPRMWVDEWYAQDPIPPRALWIAEYKDAIPYALQVMETHWAQTCIIDEMQSAFRAGNDTRAVLDSIAGEHRHSGTWLFTTQNLMGVPDNYESEMDEIVVRQYLAKDVWRIDRFDHPDRRSAFPTWATGMDLATMLRDERMCHGCVRIFTKESRLQYEACRCRGANRAGAKVRRKVEPGPPVPKQSTS